MSVWAQIVEDHVKSPSVKKLAGHLPDMHKRCSMCQKIKPRTEYYKDRGDTSNSVSSKCKPCHIAHNNKRVAAQKGKR